MNKRILVIISFLGLLVVVPLVWWLVSSTMQGNSVPVSVVVVPSDAAVKVGDTTYKNKTSVRLEPGTYTVTVSKDGFESTTQTIVVQKAYTDSIVAGLLPKSESATQWYKTHQSLYQELEGKAGDLIEEKSKVFNDMYPITKYLPIQKAIYTIGYKQVSNDPTKGIIITINAGEGYREAALQEIRDLGFKPGEYTIEFLEYRNPFNE